MGRAVATRRVAVGEVIGRGDVTGVSVRTGVGVSSGVGVNSGRRVNVGRGVRVGVAVELRDEINGIASHANELSNAAADVSNTIVRFLFNLERSLRIQSALYPRLRLRANRKTDLVGDYPQICTTEFVKSHLTSRFHSYKMCFENLLKGEWRWQV